MQISEPEPSKFHYCPKYDEVKPSAEFAFVGLNADVDNLLPIDASNAACNSMCCPEVCHLTHRMLGERRTKMTIEVVRKTS